MEQERLRRLSSQALALERFQKRLSQTGKVAPAPAPAPLSPRFVTRLNAPASSASRPATPPAAQQRPASPRAPQVTRACISTVVAVLLLPCWLVILAAFWCVWHLCLSCGAAALPDHYHHDAMRASHRRARQAIAEHQIIVFVLVP